MLMSVLAATLFAAAMPAGPAGSAFYQPPTPLPPGTHGDVIWSRPLGTSAALPDAARNVLVLYHTTSVAGADVAVSGTVAIPRGTPPAGGWPIVSWTHGTTGDAPACTPSLDAEGAPVHDYLKLPEALLDAFVKNGWAVVATDYEGQGTPGIHPYLVGEAEARDATDMVRAARQIDASLGSRWVVMGHSQGGQAALFTAALGPAWAPELKLLGVAAQAPAAALEPFLQYLSTATTPLPAFGYAGLLFEAYGSVYPDVKLASILSPAALAMLPQTQSLCVAALVKPDSWGGMVPSSAFAAGADLHPLMAAAAANNPGTLHISVPVLLLQGAADTTVPQVGTDALDTQLCGNGSSVSYDVYPGASHEGVVPASAADASAWIAARFAGTASASACGSPPATRS